LFISKIGGKCLRYHNDTFGIDGQWLRDHDKILIQNQDHWAKKNVKSFLDIPS